MTKVMTREEREKLSNRLILNFGILLCGALIMLYVYNFISAGYAIQTAYTVGIIGIISAVVAIVFFVLGKTKFPKIKNYSAIFFGMFIAALVTYAPRFGFVTKLVPAFTMKVAVVSVFILMAVYFIVLSIVTAVILKTHPEAPLEKKKIQHASKGKKKKKKK